MRVRRMRLVLPAGYRRTAELDARLIAKAAAEALSDRKASSQTLRVELRAVGQPAQAIASELGQRLRSTSPHGPKGA